MLMYQSQLNLKAFQNDEIENYKFGTVLIQLSKITSFCISRKQTVQDSKL
jgi:hypothetical protein